MLAAPTILALFVLLTHGAFADPKPLAPAREAASLNASIEPTQLNWVKLATEPYRGKQDDIFFLTPELGFYGNGAGKIFKTTDGGQTWALKLSRPGTYFRAMGFVDEKLGFAGNIGTDYFPGVTDTTPLFVTRDGGETWSAVPGLAGAIKGICAIDVLHVPFINAGYLEQRTVIHAAGRVGGPAVVATSTDLGQTWQVQDLSAQAGMILDVKFLDTQTGFLCAATHPDIEQSHALILMTRDGGKHWTKQYESTRPFESTWKCAFPTREVGYATIQNYNPATKVSQRYVAKTSDGGKTWKELPLVDDHEVQEFGIGFATPELGWVGAMKGGYLTRDGGKSWSPVPMGRAVNKIRLLPTPRGLYGYAIGVDVYKLQPEAAPSSAPADPPVKVIKP